jgi:hypothetical protein
MRRNPRGLGERLDVGKIDVTVRPNGDVSVVASGIRSGGRTRRINLLLDYCVARDLIEQMAKGALYQADEAERRRKVLVETFRESIERRTP